MGSLSTLTQTRLAVLKSIEDGIDKHKRDHPDSNIPAGSIDAIGFLLDFYSNIEGWNFHSTNRLAERYNRDLIDNRISQMSCDY